MYSLAADWIPVEFCLFLCPKRDFGDRIDCCSRLKDGNTHVA